MQMGFINNQANSLNNCVVPIEFTHSYSVGQTGCGKTTGYIYPNLKNRIKNKHGILLYDYKGKEHLSVKYLANKYNRLNDVIEIGKDWASSINIIKHMNKAQLFDFFKLLNGKTSSDMYWANSSANICTEILSILKITNKIFNLCKTQSKTTIDIERLNRLLKVSFGFEMSLDYTLLNLSNIVCRKRNILNFLEKMDRLKYVFDQIITIYVLINKNESKDNLDKYIDIFNEIINLEDQIIVVKKALATFSNESNTSETEFTTLDSLISIINTPLSTLITIKCLNNDELNIIDALNKGKIIVINTNSFSDQIISALNSSIFFELSKNSLKIASPISIFIDEAQKVVSEDFNLPVDILRECKVEVFLAFQNEELMIEKLGVNKFNSLLNNLKRRYIFKNPTIYKNIEELSKLGMYEYYDDMLVDFKIYKIDKPILINKDDFFKVELKYQNLKKIKEKYSYKSENQNHILVYDDSLMEEGILILRDENNEDYLVNVYKKENFNRVYAKFINTLNDRNSKKLPLIFENTSESSGNSNKYI